MARKDAGKTTPKTTPKPSKPKAARGAATPAAEPIHIVARNRRARFEYDLIEKVEAGLVLVGSEVKSLRNGRASLEEAYAMIEKGELWLLGCDIPEYVQANQLNHKAKRPRKLLVHKGELAKLESRATEKGLTLVPLSIYFKRGIAKVELSIARGRKTYDKREALKSRDAKRDIDRALRRG
jgi:SsrA-binding protein